MPPLKSNNSYESAIKHSPEFACLPFKSILSDFIYGIENGADFILFGGGRGQCRLGYYGDLQAEILNRLNYRAEFVCLDLSNLTVVEVLRRIGPLVEGKSIFKIISGIYYAVKMCIRDSYEDCSIGCCDGDHRWPLYVHTAANHVCCRKNRCAHCRKER